jgi:NAD(P)-dependent dehydrogenase (short-subunit alcohol dehydrogenase family)
VSAKVALTFVSCDLTSLAAVAVAAKEIRSLVDRIDIFLGNAGIMAAQPGLTKDGYESEYPRESTLATC